MSGQADFLPARIFVISFNKIIDIVYLSNLSGNEWNCDIFYSSPHFVYALFIGPICRLVSSSYQQNTARNSWTSRCRYRSRTTDIFPNLRWHLLFWVTVLLPDVPSTLGKHPFINYSSGNLMPNNFLSLFEMPIFYTFRYSPLDVLI